MIEIIQQLKYKDKDKIKNQKEKWVNFKPTINEINHNIKKILHLGSDSKNGNSHLVKFNNGEWALFDYGVSSRKIENMLKPIKTKISHIFLSHQHSDHNSAIKYISKEFPNILIEPEKVENIKDKNIQYIKVPHCDTKGMRDRLNMAYFYNGLLYLTDAGKITQEFKDFVKNLLDQNKISYILIESNHCWHYVVSHPMEPAYMKRTLSDKGHLSFEQTYNFIEELNNYQMKNNRPTIYSDTNGCINIKTLHISDNSLNAKCPYDLKWQCKISKEI